MIKISLKQDEWLVTNYINYIDVFSSRNNCEVDSEVPDVPWLKPSNREGFVITLPLTGSFLTPLTIITTATYFLPGKLAHGWLCMASFRAVQRSNLNWIHQILSSDFVGFGKINIAGWKHSSQSSQAKSEVVLDHQRASYSSCGYLPWGSMAGPFVGIANRWVISNQVPSTGCCAHEISNLLDFGWFAVCGKVTHATPPPTKDGVMTGWLESDHQTIPAICCCFCSRNLPVC